MKSRHEKRARIKQLRAAIVATALALLVVTPAALSQSKPGNEKKSTEASQVRAAFERFKKLEGNWKGRSTKGWEEAVTFKTIAQGSVVASTSFDAHPNETMMTLYHLDGDRLMLTHYCVAKNQPRLVATSISDDGKTVTFTFLDGANIPTRDRGHMDKAVFRFITDNRIRSQWTWYQNGKESWMEEIELERKP
jgi:hypothetical protein